MKFNYHDGKTSVLEGAFARGDRRLADVLITAYKLGCKFDGWQEYFDFDQWQAAFDAHGISMDFYTRSRAFDEILPWDFIDVGVRKEFLLKEYEKSLKGQVTPDCRGNCVGCGINIDLIGREC